MEEARFRIDGINYLLNGPHGFGPGFVEEFAYLQLRFLAEIIAASCLIAHGEIPETKRLRDIWQADKIISTLSELHPDFYPHPVKRGPNPAGGIHLSEGPADFLTKDQFAELVGRLGGKLHRGKLKNILKKNLTIQNNYPEIGKWTQKIINLLSEHRIMFKDGTGLYYCALNDLSVGGNVNIVLAEVVSEGNPHSG